MLSNRGLGVSEPHLAFCKVYKPTQCPSQICLRRELIERPAVHLTRHAISEHSAHISTIVVLVVTRYIATGGVRCIHIPRTDRCTIRARCYMESSRRRQPSCQIQQEQQKTAKPLEPPRSECGGFHHACSVQERHQIETSRADIGGTIEGSALRPEETKVTGSYINVDGDALPILPVKI